MATPRRHPNRSANAPRSWAREEVGAVALDLVRAVLRVRGEGLVELLGTLEVTPKR